MSGRVGIREGIVSAAVFGTVLFALVSLDPRLRDHVSDLYGNGNVTPFGDRVIDLAGALASAARYQSTEHAPLLVFATVGAVLTVFMLRS